MNNLIIDESDNETKILLVNDNEIIEQYLETSNDIEGNIYVGKIQNVLPKLEAVFVSIGQEKNALLPYKDIITEEIKPGKYILVQVKKNAVDQKGAKLTQKINFPGKYIVLLPTENFIATSHKIQNNNQQELIEKVKQIIPNGMGAILRTSSIQNEEATLKELKELLNNWNEIQENSKIEKQVILYKEDSRKKKIIRNLSTEPKLKIIVNNEKLKVEVEQILQDLQMQLEIQIIENPITSDFQKQLDETKKKKIWLKSGGYIIIDKTEALNVIDVNTGKNIKSSREITNKEATIEIARQIRMRNLRGIIIIDYINMETYEQREEIIRTLEIEMQKDRAKHEIYGFTKLDLLEITRRGE